MYEIATQNIVKSLDADLSAPSPAVVNAPNRINSRNIQYAENKGLIQPLVDKVIYSQENLIFYLTTDVTKLQLFAKTNFINQKSDPMEFTVGDNRIVITVPIVLRKYENTAFDKSMNGVLTVTDNNLLIVKAFASAWKHRETYEECGDADTVAKKYNVSPMTVYI